MTNRLYQVIVLLTLFLLVKGSPKTFSLPLISGNADPYFEYVQSAYKLALDDINQNPDILPNTKLEFLNRTVEFATETVAAMIELNERNITIAAGNDFEDHALAAAQAANVFGIAQISGIVTVAAISDKEKYPFFSRTVHNSEAQIFALLASMKHFKRSASAPGWDEVAIVSLANSYGIELAELFIENSEPDFSVVAFQQFLLYSEDFDIELMEVKNSGARIILMFFYAIDYLSFSFAADEFGLIGDNYVWFASDDLVASRDILTAPEVQNFARGIIAPLDDIGTVGPTINDEFSVRWKNLNQIVYPGSGTYADGYVRLHYDCILVSALAIDILDRQGLLDTNERIPPETWNAAIRSLDVQGTGGRIYFDENGDRDGFLSLYYYNPDTPAWEVWAHWDESSGLDVLDDVIWYSNSTDIPDLDIREPFNYWSCHDGEERNDPSGKIVSLHTPDGSDIDEIESHYHCDYFIDCNDFSDEQIGCASNYLALFIVFGILTGILMCIAIFFFIFVIIFGLILRYVRLRAVSPIFLMITVISIFVGYSSVFTWFGKPHPVACAFQPWLLGLPTVSMIAALCAKNWRIYRIFRNALKRQRISDLELLICWTVAMIPALLIVTIWTIVATPTAKMKDFDGEEHYVCSTGGFTGESGGYIFFGILVGYTTIILMLGIFLSIVTRNVPSSFNESKLLAVSMYNLGFLAAVIIPVYLIVQPLNPFLAWILRTCAILYAFTATMVLQFVPVIIHIAFIDRLANRVSIRTENTSPSDTDHQ